MIVDFFFYYTLHLRIVPRQRDDRPDVFLLDTDCLADGFKLSCSGRILPAGHSGSKVVAYAESDVRLGIHGIKEACHPAMGECRISYDSDRRPDA